MELELDSRIKEGKRPLTCFDTEQAMQFIGKQCYFSDDATDFMDLDKADGDSTFYIAQLQNIWTAEEYCFADNSNDYRYILPCEWVEQPKKPEFEQYTLDTWGQNFKPGDVVFFRGKEDTPKEKNYYKCMYLGYLENNRILVILGAGLYAFDELFNLYEIYRNGTWEPFGRKTKKGPNK